jgi:hypothetical protein
VLAANGLDIKNWRIYRIEQYTGVLAPPDTRPDPNAAMIDGLLSVGVREGFVSAYSHCLLGTDSCGAAQMPIFEHAAVSLIAQERRLPIWVHYLADLDRSKPDTFARQIRERGGKYVLVDMFAASDFPEINHKHPLFQLTQDFIEFARNGFPPGFSKLGCFETLGRPMCVYVVAEAGA